MTAKTVYTLTNDNELKVEMQATTDKTTLVNMAHHSYWNLGGHNSGTILDHELTLYADQYTPGTPMVPDGRITPVKGTPFDFTTRQTDRQGSETDRRSHRSATTTTSWSTASRISCGRWRGSRIPSPAGS